MRCNHEASLYPVNSFVTLTYGEAHLPEDQCLNHEHFQLFMKRLRKKFPSRFFMCGEYGGLNGRPHYHAILFGVQFDDRYYWRRSKSGFVCHRSAMLESLWKLGNCEIGSVTPASAAYIASYGLVQREGRWIRTVSGRVNADTGEFFPRVPEYMRCSLKPGIGARWYEKFSSDVHVGDYVVLPDGQQRRVPRYYDKLLEASDPEALRQLKIDRRDRAKVETQAQLDAGAAIAKRRRKMKGSSDV